MSGLRAPMNWGMLTPALPTDYASLATYQAMPQVNYGFDAASMPAGTLGLQANGYSLPTPNLTGGVGVPATNGIDWGSSKFWLGDRNQPGAAGLALGGANFLMNSFLGWQQLGVAKDSLAAAKDQFAKNFAAQQKTLNTQLEDRQRARVASNAGAYQSVGDYMAQNKV